MRQLYSPAPLLIGAVMLCRVASAQAPEALVSWGPDKSPYVLSQYDCANDHVGLIMIQGTIELVHPDDKGESTEAPEIVLKCDKFYFAANSKILTKAALYVRGDVSIGGSVNIENNRGASGADANVDPSMYLPVKMANGPSGARGGSGHDAVDTSDKYPLGRNAATGEVGGAGGRGTDGGTGSPASSGHDGRPGAHITIKARTYIAGTTVTLKSIGGAGGKGADGGRGQDGGDGGDGGIGGKGGDAAVGRTAADGGAGGSGGDGGNGGWGGRGGDGGNGGRGGDLAVYIIADDPEHKGNPPSEFTYKLDGGAGGAPGIGGAPGHGGKGGKGGFGGCGGSGSYLGPIVFHPDGSCGGQGPRGNDGRDGQPGPAGIWGKDGPPGMHGDWQIAFVVEKGGH